MKLFPLCLSALVMSTATCASSVEGAIEKVPQSLEQKGPSEMLSMKPDVKGGFGDRMMFIPFQSDLGLHSPVDRSGFEYCGYLDAIESEDGDSSRAPYAKLQLKENVEGIARFGLFYHPSPFQAFKHIIDNGGKYSGLDRVFLENLRKSLVVSLDSAVNRTYSIPVEDEGFYCFVGYQEVAHQETVIGENSEPIVTIEFDSFNSNVPVTLKLQRQIFLSFSIVYGLISLWWAIRCICSRTKLHLVQVCLFCWFSFFILNHPVKQRIFSIDNPDEYLVPFVVSCFTYFLGDGIEYALYSLFITTTVLGFGTIRRTSKKMVLFFSLLTCGQAFLVNVAPMVYPLLYISGSDKACVLRMVWVFNKFLYLPLITFLGAVLAFRFRLKKASQFDTRWNLFALTLAIIILFAFNDLVIFDKLQKLWKYDDTTLEYLKIVNGGIKFVAFSILLGPYSKLFAEPKSLQLDDFLGKHDGHKDPSLEKF
ncbi:Schizosaccharomyces specific multicopy membrane protein family 1 [Schizosaccharomyces pombe]|uniref:Uncharacterized membrane protein C569.06 n=1 Tax=Schizosaccharomyces pombe (strain 972 / ATCC 24843) TaxID=284812 RepID=YQO6_SCHPO|nr:uncharacterized protein SPCC569.06 [Schizosaccharomyces pombe]Q9Y7S5.1 RecName: Full=Uncharacterized membrane protein C569.06; Flags: Precursor [Schizosaccharomyces pombe 972h-]CAB42067.1 S. pombe specific multicopy membrane protein family 1 [Schizosaccharomyces pombe]|eukprot:NP_588567.1 uncharacterized protein SPCC569.06 [Schizosaccharomyces pombe]